MNMKGLLIVSMLTPLLSTSMLLKAAGSPPAKTSLRATQSDDKMILLIMETVDNESSILFNNKYVVRFLEENFVIKKKIIPSEHAAYLIYDGDRNLVHRVRHENYPLEMAVKLKKALDPATQYYTLVSRFEKGDRSVDLLKGLITAADEAGDIARCAMVMEHYLQAVDSSLLDADLSFVAKHTVQSGDPGFRYLMEKSAALDKLAAVIFRDQFISRINEKKVDVASLVSQTKQKYSTEALAPYIEQMALEFLEMREDWDNLGKMLPDFIHKYGAHIKASQLEYYNGLLHSVMKSDKKNVSL